MPHRPIAMSHRASYDPYYYPHSATQPPPSWPAGPPSVAAGGVPPHFYPGYPHQFPHPHHVPPPPSRGRPPPGFPERGLPGPQGPPRRPARPQSGSIPAPPPSEPGHYFSPGHAPPHRHAPQMPRNSDPSLPQYFSDPAELRGQTAPPRVGRPRVSMGRPGPRTRQQTTEYAPAMGQAPELEYTGEEAVEEPMEEPEEYPFEYHPGPQMGRLYPGPRPPPRALTPPQSVYSVAHAPPAAGRGQPAYQTPTRGQGSQNYPPLTRATTDVPYRRPHGTFATPDRRGSGPAPQTPAEAQDLALPSRGRPRRRYSASAYPYGDDMSVYSAPGHAKMYPSEEDYYAAAQSEYGGDYYSNTGRYYGRGMPYPSEPSPPWEPDYSQPRATAPALGRAVTDAFSGVYPPPHTYTPPETAGWTPPPDGFTAPPTVAPRYAPPQNPAPLQHAPPQHAPPQSTQGRHALPAPQTARRPRRTSSHASFPALCTLPRVPSPNDLTSDDDDFESENDIDLPTRPPSPADGPSRKQLLRQVGYPENAFGGAPRRGQLRLRSRSCATSRSRSRYDDSGPSRSASRYRHLSGAASNYGEMSRSQSRYRSTAASSYGDTSRSRSRLQSKSRSQSRSQSRGRSGYGEAHHERARSKGAVSHTSRLASRHASGGRRRRTPGPRVWDEEDDESDEDTEVSSGSDVDDDEEQATSESEEQPHYKGFVFDGIEEMESTISGHGHGVNGLGVRGTGYTNGKAPRGPQPIPMTDYNQDDDEGYYDYGMADEMEEQYHARGHGSEYRRPKASGANGGKKTKTAGASSGAKAKSRAQSHSRAHAQPSTARSVKSARSTGRKKR